MRKFTLKSIKFYVLLITALSSLNSIAQDKDNYALLWKIEHKDYKSPSYLFGTMHVEDKRVFNFSDAVLPAIESVDYFALEVHPDTLITAFSKQKYEITANEYFKKLLSKKDYKRLLKRFKEINNYALEDSEIMNPNAIEMLLIPETKKDDDKSTFVDLHLLGHAQTMKKKIVGLENVENQINHFSSQPKEQQIHRIRSFLKVSVDSIKNTKEQMTKIYATGSLKKIKQFLDQYEDYNNETMTFRNIEMANSISDFMKNGSIFAAVGAAHLVGDNNMLQLLREKGYTVTVVKAKFTGVANTYKIDLSKGNWYHYNDDNSGYSLEIPKKPNLEEDFGLFKIYGYADISTNTNYMFMGFDISASPIKREKLLDTMIPSIAKNRGGKIISKKRLLNNDDDSYDALIELPDDILMKSRFTIKNDYLYFFSAETKQDQINENHINRFFNSITITGVEKKSDPKVRWQKFKNEKGAFSIEVPEKVTDISRSTPNPNDANGEPYFLNMYMASDKEKRNNYLFRYNDQPNGYFIDDSDKVFEHTKNTFLKKSELLSEPKVIFLDGIEGREYEISLNNKYHSIVRVYYRGNRTYLLLKQKPSLKQKADTDDPFFNDFKFLPYEKPELKKYKPEDDHFEINLFENIITETDTTGYDNSPLTNYIGVNSTNPNSGGVYHYGYNNIGKYFRITSYKKGLGDYKDGDLEYNDSITNERFLVKGGDSIIEFSVKNKKNINTTLNRISRIWIANKKLHFMRAYVSDEELTNGIVDTIFNSVKINNSNSDFDIFKTKANDIITDLKSKDSLIYKEALRAFNYYEFDKNDLPEIYDTLEYYFSSDKNDVIKKKLITELTYIDDASSVDILKNLYHKSNDNIKSQILVSLPDIKVESSLSTYKDLILSDPPKHEDTYDYSILQPFQDSLSFALENFNKLILLTDYKQYRKDIINIASDMITSKIDSNLIIKTNYSKLLSHFETDYNAFRKNIESKTENDDEQLMLAYLRVLNELKTDKPSKADKITLELLTDNIGSRWLKLQAILARIFNGYDISESILNTYLEDMYNRFEIMEAYQNIGKLKELDTKEYLSKSEFARLSVYNFIAGDYSIPDEIHILDQITRNSNDFFAIKVTYNDEESDNENAYITLVGPIEDINTNDTLKAYNVQTNWDVFDDNWLDVINGFFEEKK